MILGGGERPHGRPHGGAPPADRNFFGVPERHILLGLAGVIGIAILVVGVLGFASVEITEYGLNYSLVARKVERRTYLPGRYWISPVNFFLKFPAVVTTIQFSDSKQQYDLSPTEQGESQLRSRTRDGLDVFIELSFQYQLMGDKLYDLYTLLGGYPDYHHTFVRLAVDRLTETATKFSATEFFTQRTLIGKEMEALLVKDFEDQLFSHIFSFQLRSVGLPPEFEDSIQETEVMKQELSVALAEQNSTRVSLETQLMQAQRRVLVAANRGEAEASAVLLANAADIAQYNATQQKSADGYVGILQELGSKEAEMLAYMETRVLRDHPGEKTVVGLDLRAQG